MKKHHSDLYETHSIGPSKQKTNFDTFVFFSDDTWPSFFYSPKQIFPYFSSFRSVFMLILCLFENRMIVMFNVEVDDQFSLPLLLFYLVYFIPFEQLFLSWQCVFIENSE